MNRFYICNVVFVLLVSGCSVKKPFSYDDFDYSNSAGCNPFNIGHRLGGDLAGNTDNTLQAMDAVASMQIDSCFKYWEFDVGQAADGLVVWHDMHVDQSPLLYTFSAELPAYAPSLEQLFQSFKRHKVIRPIVIDLKYIPDKRYWPELKHFAQRLQRANDVPVWFITSARMVEVYAEICEVVTPEFDIRLYAGKGDFCGEVKTYFQIKSENTLSKPL